jgi:hypothetical protein
MKKRDTFFVGWSDEIPRVDRRFVLGAGAALIAGGAVLATALGRLQNAPGDGAWNQGGVRAWTGLLLAKPYPMLRTLDLGAGPRTAFLATSGKTAVRLPTELIGRNVTVTASLIERANHAMLAAVDGRDWIAPLAQAPARQLAFGPEQDLGPTALVGEILDAKCWFGAMRPGYGKSHKACATLCARGGLPLAFCADACSGSDAPLLLDENGRAHGRAILSYVADPVFVIGRRVQVGDTTQFRAPITSIRRL